MAQLMEYAEYLSKEIGPRPAGTEEEQQAALYITERFQKDSGFSAQIEEFTSSSNVESLSAVPGLVVIVVAILAMLFPVLSIPAFILAAAAAALYTLEAFGRPVVTRALARGASQNVVAKYQPNAEDSARGRTRKVVLVAYYDSGKVTPGFVRAVESVKLPVSIGVVCVAGIVLAAFFLLLHVFVNAGVGAIVVNVLTVITLVVCAYPVARVILYRMAPYNEGANNNATGAAALVEVARRISRGSVSEADLADASGAGGVTVHGEAAARESGLVPEGAQIRYEAERLVPPSELGEYDDEERLLAAKAAIAAMTGQPVERRAFGTVASHLVNSRAHGEDPMVEVPADPVSATVSEAIQPIVETPALTAAPAVQEVPANDQASEMPAEAPAGAQDEPDGFKNAPSWFVTAQQNAKRPAGETGPVQRSRYAEAIEAAEREAAERERERGESERLAREAQLKAREQAAREAIEQSARAAISPQRDSEPAPAPAPAETPALAPAAEKPSAEAPVFVPYSEAVSEEGEGDMQPPAAAPTADEFAESLGKTVAFDPRMVQSAAQGPAAGDDAAPVAPEQGQQRLDGVPSPADAPRASSAPETTSPSRSGLFRKLRADVPSMSGVIRMQQAGEDVRQLPMRQPGAVPAASAPVRNAPAVADDAVDYDMSPAEVQGLIDAGSGRGDVPGVSQEDGHDAPGQVNMPTSRAGGFMDRFRRGKQDELAETPQEWLDVDDDFDARTVGRNRGGWESFRNEGEGDPGDSPQRRSWEGGSYSRVRLGRVDTRSGENAEADMAMVETPGFDEDHQIADEIEQIYHFRNPQYNTEIWFVALGSENMFHDGAKAFLAEHSDELRGSMIIEVESLGAGDLSVASAEGRMRPIAASSRIKRYTHEATAATGIAPGSVDLSGSDSAASVFQAAGYQAMHVLGVENGAAALKGSPDDILENVDDLLFDDNVNFLMELLKK